MNKPRMIHGTENQNMGDFLTISQVANLLNVSKRTIQRIIEKGIGPPVTKIGNQRRFSRKKVIEWADSGGSEKR